MQTFMNVHWFRFIVYVETNGKNKIQAMYESMGICFKN